MKITLCGSSRFKSSYAKINKQLALMGHLVYSLSLFPDDPEVEASTEEEKSILDLVQLAKIMNSDAILVIDVPWPENEGQEPYVGFSTSRAIAWARILHKIVYKTSDTGDMLMLSTF